MPLRVVAFLAALALPLTFLATVPGAAQARPVGPDVVNGREPQAGEFDFLAAVLVSASGGGYYSCGGSFVSSTQIVTAAHCFFDDKGRRLTNAVAAPADGTTWPSGFTPASAIDIHGEYSPSGEAHDIALITLSQPVSGVSTVTIPTASQWAALTTAGSSVTSAGWGTTSSGGSSPDDFLVADLAVVPDSVCGNYNGTYRIGSVTYRGIGSSFDADQMICAGGATFMGDPIDTCQGDSGGPLVSGTTLVGIVSWGIGCAGMDGAEAIRLTPGVYTRLGTFLPWLAERGVGSGGVTVPGAPTGLKVTSTSTTTALLTWTPPSDDGGAPLTGYKIDYVVDGGTPTLLSETEDVGTSVTITDLEPGSTYQFRVAALNSSGASAWSQPTAPITMPLFEATVPGAVSGFTAGRFVKRGATFRVTVRWQPPADDGGADILGYVARVGSGRSWSAWADLNGPATVLTSLRPATRYTVEVRAINEKGPGETASATLTTPRR